MAKPVKYLLGVALLLVVFRTGAAHASDNRKTVHVNYVYAAQLGIGGYNVGGLRADVFTLPLSYTFDLEGKWRIKATLPISLGLYRLDVTDEDGRRIQLEQQTLAVLPGIELQIPVSEAWTLKPYAEIGTGRVLEQGAPYALIYSAGIRSLYRIPWQGLTFSVGNGLFYAGNGTSDENQQAYSALENGIDIRRSLGVRVGSLEPDMGLFAISYLYPRPLQFDRFLQDPLKVQTQLELGFSVGSAAPFELFGMKDPRVGASYIFGDGLTVFRINFGFPF